MASAISVGSSQDEVLSHGVTDDFENCDRTAPREQSDPYHDGLAYSLVERTNKSLISESLNRIYCDTLENALSCWLTERTCPYTNEGINKVATFSINSVESERSVGYTSRMVSKVCRLDHPSSFLRERPLTRSENQVACRALTASIMAFAAQWSQPSSISAEMLNGSHAGQGRQDNDLHLGQNRNVSSIEFEFAEAKLASFDRSLQEALWNDARRALQDAVGIDSFQVMFARLVFAFTQKPLSRDQFMRMRNLRSKYKDRATSISSSFTPYYDSAGTSEAYGGQDFEKASRHNVRTCADPLEDADSSNELLICDNAYHLETALMELSAKRIKLNEIDTEGTTGVRPATHHSRTSGRNRASGSTDRKVFNHLFWLVMMCDTLSSAINNRPPIVSDEDSIVLPGHAAQLNTQDTVDMASNSQFTISDSANVSVDNTADVQSSPWGSFFLESDRLDFPKKAIVWPCSFEDAAVYLSEAAPVKVLLFRKVKQLQNLIFRRAHAKRLETGILEALTVYEHWNRRYGDFLLNCIRQHHDLPSRIQSWYSVLTGHWHLASLMLADAIEKVDRAGRTEKLHSAVRQSCGLILEMRKRSAFQMAAIGQVGGAQKSSSFRQNNDFHSSVNEGALLTEPWTEVLIRSFAKSAEQLLRWLIDCKLAEGQTPEAQTQFDANRLRTSCCHCVGALFDLGRKSDMSFLLAISLQQRLDNATQA